MRVPDAGDVYQPGQYNSPSTGTPYTPPAPPAPPAAPAAPTPNAPSIDPGIYGAQKAAAQSAWSNAMTSIRTKRLSALQKYGFLADVDPVTGAMTNVRVDPNNPFGGYQTMLRGEANSADDLNASEHARGITGGVVGQDLANNDFNVGLERSNFGRGMTDEMAGYDQGILEAGTTRDTSMAQINWQAAQDALQSQSFNQPDYVTALAKLLAGAS